MKDLDIKNILKTVKSNENLISTILGVVAIILLGFFVLRYFSNKGSEDNIPPVGVSDEIALPTTHIVEEGEDLWSISEKYYDSGYNWIDIANENNLNDPNKLEAGQKLEIPLTEAKTVDSKKANIIENDLTEDMSDEVEVSVKEDLQEIVEVKEAVDTDSAISGDTYTVVKGDNLWDICVRAFGDGYKWTQIASLNDLSNPDLIHPGNVLKLK